MIDQDKSKQELIEELAEMRRRVAALENAAQENQSAATLLQIAPLGIHEIDTTGRITFVNPSQESITGYTADELVGTYVWNRIEPGRKGRPCVPIWNISSRKACPHSLLCQELPEERRSLRCPGRLELQAECEGQVTGFVCILCDVTERKRAEETLKKAHGELEQRVQERTAELAMANENLRQSNDELQAMYDGMFDGLLIVDLESKRFARANASICQILGYSEAELLCMSVLDIHPADEIPVVLANIQARIEGRLQGHVDTRLLRKDAPSCTPMS